MEGAEKTFPEQSVPAVWPIKDIFVGLSIPAAYNLLVYMLSDIKILMYRPWLSRPFFYFLYIMYHVTLLLYALFICKKRNFWPLIKPAPPRSLLKLFFKSVGIVFLLNFFTGLLVLIIESLFGIESTVPKGWQAAIYAPNSFILLTTLVLAFTLGPVVEEIFFRGFLYNALKTRVSYKLAAVFQATVFSALHFYDLVNTLIILLWGIFFLVIYEKSKNLLAPIFVHGIKNAFWAVPLIILTLQNFHSPAYTWSEALKRPEWFNTQPAPIIENKERGYKQLEYAINQWGSKGARKWKMAINALNAVCEWFPEDEKACSNAKLQIAEIYYYYLQDFRRAVIEADNLLSNCPEEKRLCAKAMAYKGWAYYMLKDFDNSRREFKRIVKEFKEFKESYDSAQRGLEWLAVVDNDE